jgi:antitoxin YefM
VSPLKVGQTQYVGQRRSRSLCTKRFTTGSTTDSEEPLHLGETLKALPNLSDRGTIVTMTTTDSLRNVKDRFSEFVDRVDREHERIVVTRNGRPAAVLISPDDLESLEETLELLSDGKAVRALLDAEAAVASGDVVRGVDAVRALRPSPPR